MDRSIVQALDHGHRAGTHRVPAGLVVGAPDHRSVAVRLGRPVHHVARVQRDAPPRDARRAARLLPGATGSASSRPVSPPIRDRSFGATRIAGWRGCWSAATVPAAIVGALFNDFFETAVPRDRPGRAHARRRWRDPVARGPRRASDEARRRRDVPGRGRDRRGPGARALIPGISRSGISISAGRFAGLDREAAARFAFLMATPITAGAVVFEGRKLVTGEAGVDRRVRCRCSSGARRGARLRPGCDPLHAALPADALARRLRRLPLRARRDRRWSSGWRAVGGAAHGGDEAAPPAGDPRPGRAAPIRTQQELAAALRERGFRTTQATISRDVAELGLDQGDPRRARPPTPCRRASSRPRRPARTACASSSSDLPLEIHEAGLLLVSGRCRAPPTRSRRPSTAPAGRRSPARSPATTPCSSRCRTVARCSASSAAWCASPRRRLTAVAGAPPIAALTPSGPRLPFASGPELQARGSDRERPGVLSFIS